MSAPGKHCVNVVLNFRAAVGSTLRNKKVSLGERRTEVDFENYRSTRLALVHSKVLEQVIKDGL